MLCESWRPGVAARFGLDYQSVIAANPQIIYCSLSGYGQDGPLRDVPGHDINFQAIAGALARGTERSGEASRAPEIPMLPVADLEGGTMAALLICAAWSRKLQTGEGENIDIAMADVVASWVGTRSGTAHAESESRTLGSPGYGVFCTLDSKWIALGVLAEQRLWKAICQALDLGDLEGLSFSERVARKDKINASISARVGLLDQRDALELLFRFGAPASPVLTPEETLESDYFKSRSIHLETEAGVVIRLPAKLRGGNDSLSHEVPTIGAHPSGFS